MPKNTKNTKKSEVKENWSIATVWPNEIIAAYKVKGKNIGRIRWEKPNDYGEQHTVRTWSKSIDISTDPNIVELHPVSVEVMNLPTAGWVSGSYEGENTKVNKKGDDDNSTIKPTIPLTRESTFIRRDTETGEEVIEKLGEAMWILREVFQAIIDDKLDNAKANGELKMFMGKRKNIDPFSLYRPYNAKEDGDKEVITIDDEDKVERDVPVFKVNVSFDKNTNYITANIRDLSKAKKKQDGSVIIPAAKYNGDNLTRTTIGKFMPKGSLISGIITFSDVKSHKFGLSQPFDIGFKKAHPDDEKGQRLLYVKPNKSEGVKSKLTQDQYNMQMLGDNVPEDNGDDSEDEYSKNSKANKKAAKKNAQVDSDDDTPPSKTDKSAKKDESDDDDEESPSKTKGKTKKVEEDDEEPPSKTKGKNKKVDSDEEDEEDEPPAKTKGKENKKKADSDDEEEDEPPAKTKGKESKAKKADSDEEDEPPAKIKGKKKVEEDEDEEDEPPAKTKGKDRKGKTAKKVEQDSDEEDEPPAKTKGKESKGKEDKNAKNKPKGKKSDDIEEADVDEIDTDDE
jgi:hypothetical protein